MAHRYFLAIAIKTYLYFYFKVPKQLLIVLSIKIHVCHSIFIHMSLKNKIKYLIFLKVLLLNHSRFPHYISISFCIAGLFLLLTSDSANLTESTRCLLQTNEGFVSWAVDICLWKVDIRYWIELLNTLLLSATLVFHFLPA